MERKAYVITATGTDLGKTHVAAGLARFWRGAGKTVEAVKPVMSGYDRAAPETCDAARLLAACGQAVTVNSIAGISPWRYAASLSPDRAAALEGGAIEFAELVGWCRAAATGAVERLIIEGAGGVMAPLDARHTQRDWLAALDLPVLLVAGTYLGAVSHTLAALAALREAGVTPHALILNPGRAQGVGIPQTTAALAPHIRDMRLFALASEADFAALAAALD